MHFFISFILFGFLVLVAVVITVIVLAIRAATQTAPAGTPPMHMGTTQPTARETPMEILSRRFASGEITADEYKHARDLLQGGEKT